MKKILLCGAIVTLLVACGGKDKPSIELDVGDTPTPTEVVDGGTDVCTPACEGKTCGDDGCHGNCGLCKFQIETCSDEGVCEPTPCGSTKDCPGELLCAKDIGECVVCIGDEDCPDGKTCGADHDCHEQYPCESDLDCKIHGLICDKDAGICVECLAKADCPDNQYCFETYCLDDVCTAGESYCAGLDVVECNADGSAEVVTETCTDDQYCEDGQCQDQFCPPGELFCEDDLLLTCDAMGKEVVETVDCVENELVCYQGECVDQNCTPESTWCVDDSTAAVCSDDGMTSLVAPCNSEHYCEEGSCHPWVCEPGKIDCNGEVYQVCNDTGSAIQYEEDCAEKDQHCFNGACIDTECPRTRSSASTTPPRPPVLVME
jgi:hypothetical protein